MITRLSTFNDLPVLLMALRFVTCQCRGSIRDGGASYSGLIGVKFMGATGQIKN